MSFQSWLAALVGGTCTLSAGTLKKNLELELCIEDTAHKYKGTSEALQRQEAASDSLSCRYNGGKKPDKKPLGIESN